MQEIKFQAQVTSFNIKTENRLKAQFTSILLKERLRNPLKKRLDAQHIKSKQIEFK